MRICRYPLQGLISICICCYYYDLYIPRPPGFNTAPPLIDPTKANTWVPVTAVDPDTLAHTTRLYGDLMTKPVRE